MKTIALIGLFFSSIFVWGETNTPSIKVANLFDRPKASTILHVAPARTNFAALSNDGLIALKQKEHSDNWFDDACQRGVMDTDFFVHRRGCDRFGLELIKFHKSRLEWGVADEYSFLGAIGKGSTWVGLRFVIALK